MRLITSVPEIGPAVHEIRKAGKTIGFVPTMGALHEGHLGLVRKAREEMDTTIVSVFVNPTQFSPDEDLDRYPRQIEQDTEICEREGVDILFAPGPSEMYPAGYATYVLQERYTDSFEGEIRIGHFHGVCTVCAKLFNLVRPHAAYFGQKDYQQCVVIRRMVRDLNFDLEIRLCPIVREADGLAISSRNVYLSDEERSQATCLYRALCKAEEMFKSGERLAAPMVTAMEEILNAAKWGHNLSCVPEVDYLAVVNPDSLREVRRVESEAVVLVAARFGNTRLLDNVRLSAR